jgi:cell volume regulation protein A
MARWLHVALPEKAKPRTPVDLFLSERAKTAMAEIRIPSNSFAVDKKIVELGFPKSAIIAMIQRDDAYITPNGSTEIEADDVLIVLSDRQDGIRQVYENLKINPPENEEIMS